MSTTNDSSSRFDNTQYNTAAEINTTQFDNIDVTFGSTDTETHYEINTTQFDNTTHDNDQRYNAILPNDPPPQSNNYNGIYGIISIAYSNYEY